MSSIVLTKNGRNILKENTMNGGEDYWLGYYGLAYVTSRASGDEPDITDDALIRRPYETGDYLYNIWQGDLLGDGYASAGMTGLTLYDRNVMSNYRYSYDSVRGCNRLVTWTTDGATAGSSGEYGVRRGFRVYDGVIPDPSSLGVDAPGDAPGMPVPAPLFYLGGGLGYSDMLGKDALYERVGRDWPSDADGVPLVTPDMRFYRGALSVDDDSFESGVTPADDPYGLIDPASVRYPDGTSGTPLEYVDQYAKFVSVSNFNQAHGTVSSEGYGVSGQEACHNMSRVTKLFPIARYEVTSSGEPYTYDQNHVERGSAKAIKYRIDLDLTSVDRSYRDAAEYKAPPVPGGDDDVFTAGKNGSTFKFNRIGIYAVKATIRHFYAESEGSQAGDCRSTHYQVEISPDANPVLFAVADLEEVCMSEDSDFGQQRFTMDFILNLGDASKDAGICTDVNVYYSMSENEAVTWYQNQLLATAGISEAVTSLGVDVAHVMNMLGRASAEGGTSSSGQQVTVDGTMYAAKDHTHDYMKNLVDETDGAGSVRGTRSLSGSGEMSLTLGTANRTDGNFCLNISAGGYIGSGSRAVVMTGDGNRASSTALTGVLLLGDGALNDSSATGTGRSITNTVLVGDTGSLFDALSGDYADAIVVAGGFATESSDGKLVGVFAQSDGAERQTSSIYVGGVALLGKPGSGAEADAGRIRLGNQFCTSAYIASSPISNWFAGNDYLIPRVVYGTNDCPYGGLLLGVTPAQDTDGSLHIGLYRVAAPETTFTTRTLTVRQTSTANRCEFDAEAGSRYMIPSGTVASGDTLDISAASISSLKDGDEFIIAGSAVPNVTLFTAGDDSTSISGKAYPFAGPVLCRKVSYIASESSAPEGRLVVFALN